MKKMLGVALVVLLSPLAQVLTPYAFAQSSTTYPPTYVREDSNLLYIGNGFIELQFQKSHGGIYSIINKMTGEDYRQNKVGPQLFTIFFSDRKFYFGDGDCSASSNSYTTNGSVSVLTLTNSDCGSVHATVTTTIRVVSNSSLSFWRLSLVSPNSAVIDDLLFPRIDGVSKVGNQTQGNYFLLGDAHGHLVTDAYSSFFTNPKATGLSSIYPALGGALQLWVMGNQFGGLLLSSHDTGGNPKSFDAWKGSNSSTTITLGVEHYLPEVANSTISQSYDTVLGVFKGDWYQAASIYRTWAMKQWWTAQGPLSQRSDIPSWFKSGFVDVIMQSYDMYDSPNYPGVAIYEYSNFSQIPTILANTLAKVNSPVLVEWRGWEKYGEFEAPDVFPPHDGWASFNATIAKIHAMGQHVIIPLSADDLFPNYPGFDISWYDCAVRNPDQTVYHDPGYPSLAYASVSCSRYQDWLVSVVTALAKSGVDGVRLDANMNFQSEADYNNATNHLPGYGSWWASSWTNIFNKIRTAVNPINPQFILGSEGLPEIFVPWNEFYTDYSSDFQGESYYLAQFGSAFRQTDLFQYVYSAYTVGFPDALWAFCGLCLSQGAGDSAYLSLRDYEQALEITTGSVVGSYTLDSSPPYTSLERSMSLDSAFFVRDFSTFGIRIPPPSISVPSITLSVQTFTPPSTTQDYSYTTQAIIPGAWQSEDGRLAYYFVNVDTVSHSFTFPINGTYLTQGANYDFVEFGDGAASISPFNPTEPTMSVDLPPKQTMTIEVVLFSVVPKVLMEYTAFYGAYIAGTTVLSAPATGLNFDTAQSTLVEAEDAYLSQNFTRSTDLSLQALNATAQAFGRFGQLLTDQQSYLNYLMAFNSAAKLGNYSSAFASAQSAIDIGVTSAGKLFPSSLQSPARTLLVVQSAYPKSRVDVGSAQSLAFRVVSSYDGSVPAGTTLTLNGSSAIVTNSGWANFTVSQKSPGRETLLPSGGSDSTGSLRILVANDGSASIVWDEVVIILSTNSSKIPVGSNATLAWTGYYASDKSPFTGRIVLNDTTMKTLPGVYSYVVSKVFDNKYNLTAFVSNVVKVEFISIPATATTTSQASTSSGGGIPEFPSQFVSVAVITAVVLALYLFVGRKSFPHA